MFKKRTIGVLLTFVMMFSMVLNVSASTQDEIANTKAQQQAAESDLANAQSKINGLTSEKTELETYLDSLHTQMTDLSNSLTILQEQISAKEVDLEMTQAALGRAKEQEAKQYDDMKLRIRYMYESGSDMSLLTTLLESKSISDFLNRADSISQMSAHDRDKLNTYKETKTAIAQQEEQISADKEELVALKVESEAKQAEVAELAATTDSKIAEYSAQISQEQLNASNIQEQINQQKALLQELNQKAAAEQQAAQEKAAQEAAVKAAQEAARQAAAQQSATTQSASSQSNTSNSSTGSTSSSGSSSSAQSSTVSSPVVENTSSSTTSGTHLGKFKLTAYCACPKCCGKWSSGYTASGTYATQGRTVAMAGVPFGTKLLINGNIYTVEDRGTPYGHVDIFFSSHSDALRFGLQYAEVYQVS